MIENFSTWNTITNKNVFYSGKHQKRLSAPSHWLLDKMSGTYAPKASPGPHKLRDCLPLIVFIRNRYARGILNSSAGDEQPLTFLSLIVSSTP